MIWFTSDTHFGHKNVLKYCGRPFKTVEEMDEALIANWNAIVKPDDVIYHLGDVAMSIKAVKRVLPRLNGHKILIVGNHDLMYDYFEGTRGKAYTTRMEAEYKAAGFAEIYNSGHVITVAGVTLRLSHFPAKSSYSDNRYNKHEARIPKDDDIITICGHVHQEWLKKNKSINVGVDVRDFKPLSLIDLLMELQDERTFTAAPGIVSRGLWKIYHKIRSLLL